MIGIYDDLEHHPGEIGTATGFLVEIRNIVQLQTVYDPIDDADRGILRNILINSFLCGKRTIWLGVQEIKCTLVIVIN